MKNKVIGAWLTGIDSHRTRTGREVRKSWNYPSIDPTRRFQARQDFDQEALDELLIQ